MREAPPEQCDLSMLRVSDGKGVGFGHRVVSSLDASASIGAFEEFLRNMTEGSQCEL